MTDVVVLVPMLGRAHMVDGLRESLYATTDRARLLWIVTTTDRAVLKALTGDDILLMPPKRRGDYPAKMNAGYQFSTEPLIFLAAIDVRFHPGWLDAVQRRLDDGAQVVGTNDMCNPRTADGRLSTHTMVTRRYADTCGTIDQPGAILHDGYWHEFCDDELVATAKHRGVYAHAPDAVVEHLHPANGRRPADRLDRQQAQRMAVGRRIFESRRHLWT